jgi:antitoxin component of MazEF toxin-antitoxin module
MGNAAGVRLPNHARQRARLRDMVAAPSEGLITSRAASRRLSTIRKLADALGVEPKELMKGEE